MKNMNMHHYRSLLFMAISSFISMYILMYAMVNALANVYADLNQIYMAGLMTASMAVIELALMGAMYPNKKWNALIMGAGVIALLVCWTLIRQRFYQQPRS